MVGLAGSAGVGSVTEFPLFVAKSDPEGIAVGPDGNLWFTEYAGRIGRITPAGKVDDWSTGSGISIDSQPYGITAGPDGNLWFTEAPQDKPARIGRITATGAPTATEFSNGISPGNAVCCGITAGPDGNLWFTEPATFSSSFPNGVDSIGRITPSGVVTDFSVGVSHNSGPEWITAGPDGNLWFTEFSGRIGRITPSGTVTETSLGISPNSEPFGITAGPDGNLWFTEYQGDRIGRITPAGVVTEFSAGITAGSHPEEITTGPDGNLWFTEYQGDRIGSITPTGTVTEFSTGITPGSRPEGITTGPDFNIWFTEEQGNRIGRLILDPAVTTGSASSIGTTAASLAGTVTPFGALTSYVFQYGPTTSYGSSTTAQTLAPGGKPVAVSAHITGLRPRTLYHYRLTASSTNTGADRTFTTTSTPPTLKLKAGKLTVGKAVAGKAFTVSTTVKDAKTGKGIKGQVSCTGKLAGKALSTSHRSATAGGMASCTWQLPKTAHGKRFTGTIAENYRGVRISRSFSVTVV